MRNRLENIKNEVAKTKTMPIFQKAHHAERVVGLAVDLLEVVVTELESQGKKIDDYFGVDDAWKGKNITDYKD